MCNYCDYKEYLDRAYENMTGEKSGTRTDEDYHELALMIAPHKSTHDFQFLPLTQDNMNKLKLLAGPHGHAIFKILEAKRDFRKE